jgi:BMFP domain-containing protein YqiC
VAAEVHPGQAEREIAAPQPAPAADGLAALEQRVAELERQLADIRRELNLG